MITKQIETIWPPVRLVDQITLHLLVRKAKFVESSHSKTSAAVLWMLLKFYKFRCISKYNYSRRKNIRTGVNTDNSNLRLP
jgi:hypothetical protein